MLEGKLNSQNSASLAASGMQLKQWSSIPWVGDRASHTLGVRVQLSGQFSCEGVSHSPAREPFGEAVSAGEASSMSLHAYAVEDGSVRLSELSPQNSASQNNASQNSASQNSASQSNNASQNGVAQTEADADEELDESRPSSSDLTDTADEAFELLSAYLDNEVTEEERCLVEHRLAADPELKRHYQKQLRLRQAFKAFMSEGL